MNWELELPQRLTSAWIGRTHRHFELCGSTNDELARASDEGAPEGSLVTADAQSSGRGRLGRVWHSPAGTNLYFSLLLRPTLPPSSLPPLTLLSGAVLAESLGDFGVGCRLKWPNDLVLPTPSGFKKAAGILTEMATFENRIRHLVIGVGVNVGLRTFPVELADIATSVAQIAGDAAPTRLELLAAFLNRFETAYETFTREGPPMAIAAFRSFAWLGQPCRVERGEAYLFGNAVDVDATGALLIEDESGKRHAVLSGEVVTKL